MRPAGTLVMAKVPSSRVPMRTSGRVLPELRLCVLIPTSALATGFPSGPSRRPRTVAPSVTVMVLRQVEDLGRHAARADVQGHLHRRLAVGDFELTLLVADGHEVNPIDGTECPAEPARAAIRHAGLLDDSVSDRVTASIN